MGTGWWYLSFSGDTGWLGACIVQGDDVGAAVRRAWELGCNPGGEVLCGEVPEEGLPTALALAGRLLTVDDLESAGLEPARAQT